MTLFPFAEFWWLYAAFGGLVVGLLALDLGVFHRRAHEVGFREAATWSAVWVSLALLFNAGLYFYAGQAFSAPVARQLGLEFLAGFLVEKALALDNIFIFAMVFSYFAIPKIYQHRILFYGILGALVFRAGFIALGSKLLAYQGVSIFFGALLIVTGIKMLLFSDGLSDPEKNWILRGLKRVLRVHPRIEGQRFFVRKNGLIYATPLFVALAMIELSDLIFAIDSVPAIFAISKEPLIVFTSNIFAILGLRSLYFLLAGVLERFSLVKYGLAAVLIFVGLKMAWLNEAFGGKFPIGWSLAIIVGLIGGSIAASLLRRPPVPGPKLLDTNAQVKEAI